MTINEGKLFIEQKVEDFNKNEKQYLSKTFQETEARTRFIDPLFQALGWDFDQTNIAKHLWDVQREYSQKDNSNTKKPDYAFKINGKLKFFVEAKAPWVPLTDKAPVFQAKRYAYSTNGKAPVVIITDFQEFRVFNAIERPVFDNPLQGLIKELDLKYTEYLDKWDLVYANFSKEAVLSSSIEKLIGRITKETKTLDKEFLSDLIGFREILAKNIALRNKNLDVDAVNECVQRILDRIIFIRNLEDREIEGEILFKISESKENVYQSLIPVFSKLNMDYNGLLFKPDVSDKILIDDEVIKKIIKNLYPPYSPFQFDIIEPEILGRIYEKFLGSKIRLTESHQAKVEEKPEVRHAGGVFYTPQFIVENVVLNTLGKILTENKMSPDDIQKIKILDPACGSGSFLLGAFDYLIKYHENWYASAAPGAKKKYKEDFFETQDGEIRLTIKKKSEILKNNIFGVDIDREATEVAIMSLYLKLLDQGFDKGQGFLFLKGHILPDMTGNIKCGNSLISREELFKSDMFGDESINPFDWEKEFNEVFTAEDAENAEGKRSKGFDVIIGNPPYIRIQEMQSWAQKAVEIYKNIYQSGKKGNFDIYVLFIEKAMSLLNEKGLMGMILPNKFFMADYGETIRGLISKNIYQIVDFGDQQIFDNATTYTNLLFLSKFENKNFKYAKVKNLSKVIESLQDKIIINDEYKDENIGIGIVENFSISKSAWHFTFGEDKIMFNKLNGIKLKLEDICLNISQGFKTGSDKIFIHNFKEEFLNEKYFIKVLKGEDIQRYNIDFCNRYSIFPYNNKPISEKELKENAPKIYDYLKSNKKELEERDRGNLRGPSWFCFSRTQFIRIAKQQKILTRDLADKPSFAFDEKGEYGLMGCYGLILKENLSYYYILGLLNSSLIDKFIRKTSTHFRGGFYSYEARFIRNIPIILPNLNDKNKFEKCKKIEEFVKQILEFKKQGKDKDAEFLESKIDEMVEEIYGI